MSNIEITLPDGNKQPVAAGKRPIDIARSISPRLATRPSSPGSTESYTTSPAPRKGRQPADSHAKDAESLGVYRHSPPSSGRGRARALSETKLGIGPAIDNGFYYDFDAPAPFTPEDIEKIEKKMWEIQSRDLPTSASTRARTKVSRSTPTRG